MASPLKFKLEKISATEALITLPSGEKYRFTVFKGGQNITGAKDWTAVAKQVATLFVNSAGKPFEHGEIELAGSFEDIEQEGAQPLEKDVSIVSGKVEYVEGAGENAELKVKELKKEGTVALKNIASLGDEFKKIQPVSPRPLRPSEINPPAEEFEEVIDVKQDERVKICEGRKKAVAKEQRDSGAEKPSAIYALAGQLGSMKKMGQSEFTGKTPAQIVPILRNGISKEMQNSTNHWSKAANFATVFESLNSIKEEPILINHLNDKNIKLTLGQLRNLLNYENANKLSAEEKKKLINLYAAYIQGGGEILDQTFFKAFVTTYGKKTKDYFQIVMIEGTGGDSVEKVYSYPSQESIDPQRCAFIYHDKTSKQYLSYNRGANAAATQEGAKIGLDTTSQLLSIASKTTRQKKAAAPARSELAEIPVKTVDAAGRCLDMAIAYQIMKKRYPNLPSEQLMEGTHLNEMRGIAVDLRRQAALKINVPQKDNNEAFFNSLKQAISEIPAFKQGASQEEINKVKSLYAQNEKDVKFNEIAAALKKDFSTMTADEKALLRNFYAQYIQQQNGADNIMDNYLDSPFLAVLQEINCFREFPQGINCAVRFRTGGIQQYGPPKEFNTDNWVFVNFPRIGDKQLHYDAIVDPNTIKAIVDTENHKLLFDTFF